MTTLSKEDRATLKLVNQRRGRVKPVTYGKIAAEINTGWSAAYLYNWLTTRAVEINGEWIAKDRVGKVAA